MSYRTAPVSPIDAVYAPSINGTWLLWQHCESRRTITNISSVKHTETR